MQVVYAKQDLPASWVHAIFLAGPTPRDTITPSWRPEAIKLLEASGYDGVVFVPEPEEGVFSENYEEQVQWEKQCLEMADKILFWVPRDLRSMPAFTTNVEFGRYVDTGKCILGFPPDAPKMRYLDWLAGDAKASCPVAHTLQEAVDLATQGWEGEVRTGGERYVPRIVWDTSMFKAWYDSLKQAGNRLDYAKVYWTFQIPKLKRVFSWVLQVSVWIEEEGRSKTNEWVFSRVDLATAVLFHRGDPGDPSQTEVVLVREFRSPTRTPDGYVRELPGGSIDPYEDGRVAASREVFEETGLALDKGRFIPRGSRQGVGTLSSHHIHAFAVELATHELAQAKLLEARGTTFGEVEDTERTYVEVRSLKYLLETEQVDWATMGVIYKALSY